ncbi:hypothetical protein [Actinoplanes friuliensis]|uniref:Uncharacterized protein n=1 Tax=Actinoplanes friuliensis DSM 7358 TaxID=1246995 RepID=U5W0L8_9ACTN|nr:hypothetical protein [Actinoplanes friuliensis]AGZ42654.1 hypothetical protein AFR_21920 [Actinoplanes friuliensis DSM 7358]
MHPDKPGPPLGAGPPRPPRDAISGFPDAILGFPDACSSVVPRRRRVPATRPDPWRVTDWEQPDLSYVRPFVSARYRSWPLYSPRIELVPCGEKSKAALFVRIPGGEFPQWSRSVVPRRWEWRWLEPRNHPYVVLRLTVDFEDVSGTPIGLGVPSRLSNTTLEGFRHAHQLRCATPFDPENRGHREAIEAWVTAPSPVLMIFVDENDRARAFVSLDQEHDGGALGQLEEGRRHLNGIPANRRSTFAAAAEELGLPWIDRW